jgi:hypothetical protein
MRRRIQCTCVYDNVEVMLVKVCTGDQRHHVADYRGKRDLVKRQKRPTIDVYG